MTKYKVSVTKTNITIPVIISAIIAAITFVVSNYNTETLVAVILGAISVAVSILLKAEQEPDPVVAETPKPKKTKV